MVVAELVEEAPAGSSLAVCHHPRRVHHRSGGIQVRHDRVSGVHVASADLDIAAHPLRPGSLTRRGRQVGVGVQHVVPEPERFGRIVEIPHQARWDSQYHLPSLKLCPGSGEIAYAPSPLPHIALAEHEVRGLDRVANRESDVPQVAALGHIDVDRSPEPVRGASEQTPEREAPNDLWCAPPLGVMPKLVGVRADEESKAFAVQPRRDLHFHQLAGRGVEPGAVAAGHTCVDPEGTRHSGRLRRDGSREVAVRGVRGHALAGQVLLFFHLQREQEAGHRLLGGERGGFQRREVRLMPPQHAP